MMGFIREQLLNVVEWKEFSDEILFWKWENDEIKGGSKLIIRPGQDAIFMFNGKVEGVFKDEGSFDIESQIVPFLSTLKGFKFGFNSGMRAEVLFVNTKELTVKWGTKGPVNLPAPGLPGGMPIRCFGVFNCKVGDYDVLINTIAGVKQQFSIEDIKVRVVAVLDQLLMKWISREGKDMFNLQANSFDIGEGIRQDLDGEMQKIGIAITGFNISNFSYPPEVQEMQLRAAGQSMVGDMAKYTQVAMADSLANPGGGGSLAGDMVGLQMGMMMGQQMMQQMQNQGMMGGQGYQQQIPQQGMPPQGYPQQGYQQQPMQQQGYPQQNVPAEGGVTPPVGKVNFCPQCGTKVEGGKFCSNCGQKL